MPAIAQRMPPTNVTVTATSTTSTAAIALSANGRMVFKAVGGIVYIRFGDSTVTAATAANSWPISDGETVEFYITPGWATHFRALAAAATPNLFWDKA